MNGLKIGKGTKEKMRSLQDMRTRFRLLGESALAELQQVERQIYELVLFVVDGK